MLSLLSWVVLTVGSPNSDPNLVDAVVVESSYFEGRWAFAEETCDQLTNWTMIAGGNFVSEDLMGTWEWAEQTLTLSLTDLAIDEETGETGGRFQMEGPVEIVNSKSFKLTIAPDIYEMKKCPEI